MRILICGMQGTGKTWVMLQLIELMKASKKRKYKTVYYHQGENIAIVGKYDGQTFQGSDRLSMGVMADIGGMLAQHREGNVILEGDRFTNGKFISRYKPTIIYITSDGSEGRKLRGSDQSERTIKSMATRLTNLDLKKRAIAVEDSATALEKILELLK